MGKVFGYPEFDENGEQILTTYDNEYKDMLMYVISNEGRRRKKFSKDR